MSIILRLFLPDAAPAAELLLDWWQIDGTTATPGQSTLARLPAHRRLELILPPAATLHAQVALPPGGRRQARRLLPFALDPVLLGEVDMQHLAFRVQGDRCDVVVVAREYLKTWLEALAQHRLKPHAAYAQAALLPAPGLAWCSNGWLWRDDAMVLWLDADMPDAPPPLLPARIAASGALKLALPQHMPTPAWLNASASIDRLPQPLATRSPDPNAINLLQGDFAVGPQIDLDLDRLKPAGMLAAAALGLWLISTIATWASWRHEARQLEARMNEAFTAAFPGTPLVDARAQLRQKLQAGSAPATPVTLSPLLSLAARVPRPVGAKLVAMDYHQGQLEITYEVEAAKIETVQASLAATGTVSHSAPGRLTLSLKS